MIESD